MLSNCISKQLYIFGVSYFLPYNAFNGCNYSYQQSDLVKLDILLNGQPVDAMSTIVHNSKSYRVGRELVDKLKKVIDRSFSAKNNFILFHFHTS
jgi:translation elongation factor EF-4